MQFDAKRSLNKDGSPNKTGEPLGDNTSENLIIEGDNLEVLKLLQKTYFEQVKCIYIDPPYNTGNDFIYPDDFSEGKKAYWGKNGTVKDGVQLKALTELDGRKHSKWLNMMQSRLLQARQLLARDGVIFISIDDNEHANLKKLCDLIFGEANFISTFSRMMKSGGAKGKFFTPNIDYILIYAKNKDETPYFRASIPQDQIDRYYNKTEKSGIRKGELYGEERLYKASLDARPNQRYWIECPDGSYVIPPGNSLPEKCIEGEQVTPNAEDGVWKWTYARYKSEFDKDHIIFKETTSSALVDENGKQSKYNIYNKLWLIEQQKKGMVPSNFIGKFENRQSSAELKELGIPFDFAKPVNLIDYIVEISKADEGDIILDFFAGSGSTAHAVMQRNVKSAENCKFICVQVPELIEANSEAGKAGYKTISQITIERTKRAGAKLQKENPKATIDTGFRVFKLTDSNFPQNLFSPDPEKSEKENLKALEAHLAEAAQLRMFSEDEFSNLVTEISLKNGFGLFYELEPVGELSKNKVYRLIGNDKSALLCLDNDLHDETVEGLKPFKDEQLIVSKSALDTTKKFSLQTEFKDNLWVV